MELALLILRGLVVFVVSCSCGLALSVPVAVVAAMANAARNGTVYKGGAYLEVVHKVKAVAFDKTGTLTIGRPEVTDVLASNDITKELLLDISSSIESRSGHPLAAAIVRKARRTMPIQDCLLMISKSFPVRSLGQYKRSHPFCGNYDSNLIVDGYRPV